MKFSGERFVPQETDKELQIEHLQRYYSITSLVKDKVVLDAASGEGYGSFLLSKYADKVFGIDISQEAVTHSKIEYRKENLQFAVGSVEQLDFEDQMFDIVVSFETIEHVNEKIQHAFLAEIKRVLKQDGVLVISTPDKYIYTEKSGYTNPFHVKEFYKEEFYDFLNQYFENIEFYTQKFEVSSILTNNNQLNMQDLNKKEDSTGKYIVAVCSSRPLHNNISSIYSNSNQFEFLTNRIVNLQEEVKERNSHLKNLDDEILNLGHNIILRDSEIEKLKIQVEHLNKYSSIVEEDLKTKNDLLRQKEANLDSALQVLVSLKDDLKAQQDSLAELKVHNAVMTEELKHKDEIINALSSMHNEISSSLDSINLNNEESDKQEREKDQVILNQLGHIHELLEQERRLSNILSSGGWKMLSLYYKYRDKLLPESSKRKLLTKLAYKTIKNPKVMFRNLNKQNLKKLRYYLKTEEVSLIGNRLDNFVERHTETKVQELQLFQQLDTSMKLVFPIYEQPKVSIIIPVYNQFNYTYSCLASILENSEDISFEILIADDLSTDETINISSVVENVSIIRDDINRGFLRNCNNAAQHAKGEYIFFLNNDTNVQPNWLSTLVELMENDSSAGMVGSKLVYPDGRLQEAGGIIWKDASGWNYGRLDDPEKPEYNYVKEVDYISGAAIMIRTELWKTIGGFDDRYAPAYFEDSDLAFEVRKHGYKVVFHPKSVVVHFEGVSHGTDTGAGIKSYQVKNKEKFIVKWGDTLKGDHFENARNVFLARDRSVHKKTIVVVDHYVPHFDKDAGSRTVYQYLQLFVELGLNVKFIGDNFFKHEPYTTALEHLGIEVLYGNNYSKNLEKWFEINGEFIDFVYLNRPHISINYIDVVKKYTNAQIIYYGHDLHFLRELREYQLTGNEEMLMSSERWREIEYDLFVKSDVVYYPSQVEVDQIQLAFPNIIAKAIPAYIYNGVRPTGFKTFDNRRDILFVGGFGHKPNIDAVLWFVQEVFPTITSKIPNIKFYIVGSNPPNTIKSLASDNIIVTGFVTDEELLGYYKNTKVVVVPLRYGAGVKGKVVEAMFYGSAIVTTSVGSEGLPELNESLLEADEAYDFAEEVIHLYQDVRMLQVLSERSMTYVNNHFSKQCVLKILTEDLNLRDEVFI